MFVLCSFLNRFRTIALIHPVKVTLDMVGRGACNIIDLIITAMHASADIPCHLVESVHGHCQLQFSCPLAVILYDPIGLYVSKTIPIFH